jgi:hypothetical protein
MAGAATYLYQDGPRYWYSTQPTVTKLAEDIAEQLKRDSDKVVQELERRLRLDLRHVGDFCRIHPMPQSGQDVPDDLDTRLVVLKVDQTYTKDSGCPAEAAAKTILDSRGNAPRLFRNTLVFLAPDKTRLQDLDEATRRFLAWESILADKVTLNLDPQQVKQAETQKAAADGAVTARIPETYQWLLVPTQSKPQAPMEWQALRLSGQDALAVRASKKLRNDELLLPGFAPTRLRMELDNIPLWRGSHVSIKQIVDDFARYTYLPRLKNPAVLLAAIQNGLELLLWQQESFAYADSYDDATGRYRGLRCGKLVTLTESNLTGLLVHPEPAYKQYEMDMAAAQAAGTSDTPKGKGATAPGPSSNQKPEGTDKIEPPKLTRFHGSVTLDATRIGRDAGKIADEVIAHIVGLVGSNVTVTLEIAAEIPDGASDHVVRTVTENARTLKFTDQGFESD